MNVPIGGLEAVFRYIHRPAYGGGVTQERSGPDLKAAGLWGGSLLTLRFLTELATVAALATAGALAHTAVAWRIVLAILGPVLFAVIWGRAIGPRAAHRLSDPARLVAEIAIFVVSAVALGLVGYPVAGIVLAVISIGTAGTLRAVMPGS
jgi:Protein of unknown function (DUF2568)